MVKKSNGTKRMCVDFTDLNKACLKDSCPLLKIDKLVDSTANYKLLSFMDVFSGCHQIPLAREDQEKTAYIVDTGLNVYNMIPFVLKNAGATHQHLVNKVFATLIGKTMELYVDDIITHSVKEIDHVRDLEETFKILRHYGMKLNPKNVYFQSQVWKILRYMINGRGIEANLDKIKAVLNMKSPTTVKEVKKAYRLHNRALAGMKRPNKLPKASRNT